MIAVLACEAPLTPDEEEARDWLLKELSRVEYSEAPSPIVRFVEAIIRWFTEALSWKGQGAPPISLILMIIAIIATNTRSIAATLAASLSPSVVPLAIASSTLEPTFSIDT